MKRFMLLLLTFLLVSAFAMPASALEHIFGGYWRTRFAIQENFSGDDTGTSLDSKQVDTRARFYYTAKINENLKLVNKLELDAIWGENDGYGKVGADGTDIEIKNLYADFKINSFNVLVGVQNFNVARTFIYDDDFAGIKAIYKIDDRFSVVFDYQKHKEGGRGENDQDVESYILTPVINLNKDICIKPYYMFLHSKDGFLLPYEVSTTASNYLDNVNINYLGIDFDAKIDATTLWFTGVKQFGSLTSQGGAGNPFGDIKGTKVDLKGWLIAAGGKYDFGKTDIHGQSFWATGDDNKGFTDKEMNGFYVTSSSQYYWAEILGRGMFDGSAGANGLNSQPTGSPGYSPTNIIAVNLGATHKPTDKLSITGDLWYAKLDEKNSFGEDEIGIEADLKLTYKLLDGLSLDIVGAYLFAGDAVSSDGKNDDNPFEIGTRLSLSF
ncbi:MAG: hypothetical protein ABIK92_10920 [Pseudomonadota bacterium]